MDLYIDTSTNEYVKIAIRKEGVLVLEKSLESKYKQSEKLLPFIDVILKEAGIKIADIKKVHVKDTGEGFSALRIGIVTANALAYALGVECISLDGNNTKIDHFTIVKPKYNQEPNIG